jgi:hypothetical protein
MQKKKISKLRRNNSGFEIRDDPSPSIIVELPALFGIQDSSDAPVFLPVVFLIDIQH